VDIEHETSEATSIGEDILEEQRQPFPDLKKKPFKPSAEKGANRVSQLVGTATWDHNATLSSNVRYNVAQGEWGSVASPFEHISVRPE
jgi:hypothetical protein